MIDPVEFGKAMGALVRDAVTPLLKRIEELESRQAEKGDKGDPGEPGPAGADGETPAVLDVALAAVDAEGFKTIVDMAVAAYMVENPVQDGADGKDGRDGERGERGDVGEKGADGIGLASAMIDREGALVVTKTNGETIALGRVVGSDGEKGADGRDGLGFEDVSFSFDPESGLTVRAARGEHVREETFYVPAMIHRGFWRDGMSAKSGNTTTHNGNLWIAMRETKATPCLENKEDWILAARKGRDGDKGDPGTPKPEPGPVKLKGSENG